jgi:hypothetical protein
VCVFERERGRGGGEGERGGERERERERNTELCLLVLRSCANHVMEGVGVWSDNPTKASEMIIMITTRNLPGIDSGVMSPYLACTEVRHSYRL